MAEVASTTAVVLKPTREQPGPIGALRARRATITFDANYSSSIGATLKAADLALSEIFAVIPEGQTYDADTISISLGGTVQVYPGATEGSVLLVLFNGTTLVATGDMSDVQLDVLVLGV